MRAHTYKLAVLIRQNSAEIAIDGIEIVLPAPATGYAAIAWNADTMVWTNNGDGSMHLLKRR